MPLLRDAVASVPTHLVSAASFLVIAIGCGSSEGSTALDANGSDSGTDGASSSLSQEKEYCDALASRSACSGGGAQSCDDVGKCIYAKVMLPAATSAYSKCRAAPSCKSDDTCITEAGRAVGGSAADTYLADCTAKRDACGEALKGDLCSPGIFAYPGGADAQACLQKPCTEVGQCFTELPSIKAIAACKKE